MRIFVDQQAISRNSGRQPDEQEPVFIIEHSDGRQTLASEVEITGLCRLLYDKTRQPRAWLEVEDG
jgi:hypothetical protein